LRALETGTGIAAADACGVARKIFARGGCAADAWGAGFAREEDYVVFDGRRSGCSLACVGFD
jgi:hypothetical protein